MESKNRFVETNRYRCLVYQEKQTNAIYLTHCGLENCLPGYKCQAEQRTGYHLHVIMAGRGELSVNGVVHPLRHGQMFVTKPGEVTWYRADEQDPWRYCWMTYDGSNAPLYTDRAGFRETVNWRDCNTEPHQFSTLVQRVLDRPEMTLSNDLLRLGLLLEFLSLAVESNEKLRPALLHENKYSVDVYVDYAVTYIQTNYSRAKIGDVARFIGINRSYLTSVFKQKIGVSPQEYLMQCRMEHACALLLETNAPIQNIARAVGYDNPLTFSKIFKGCYGVSPKNYRAEKQGEKEQMI